ncbi:hypothetical protein D0Z00_002154 [Geotrichum galactomycetum]|uniref:Uncharacterized protein n=1 Tax=Geotrichum galactomycetum TaxID=27317 RepID=A0ACB6V557_9ASCO|nr:hypothetical protein D0Z00_002154 [Geotrichum candidum]
MHDYKEAFPDLFNWEVDAAYSDHSDNVTRCPRCRWELEEGRCLHCSWEPAQRNRQMYDSDSHEDTTTDTEARLAQEFVASDPNNRHRRGYDIDAFYSADSDGPRPSDEEFVVPDSDIESVSDPDDEEDYDDFVSRSQFNITQNTVSQTHEFTEFGSDDDDDYSDDNSVQESMLWRPGSDRFRVQHASGHHTGVPETPPPPYSYPAVVVPPVSFQPFQSRSQLPNRAAPRATPRRLRSHEQTHHLNQSYTAAFQEQQPQFQQPSEPVLNERQRHELDRHFQAFLGNSLAERMQQRRDAAELARRHAQPASRSQRRPPAAGTTASNPVDLSATPRAPRRHRGRRNQPIIIDDEEEPEHEEPANSQQAENPDDLEGPEVIRYSAAGYLEHDPSDHRPEVDMYRTRVAYHTRENGVYEPRRIRVFDNDSDEAPHQPRQNQQQQQSQVTNSNSDSDDDYYRTYDLRFR